jgi:Sel1 repeat
MTSDQVLTVGFVGMMWFVASKGWEMKKAGRIHAAGIPYLYLLTFILSFITLVLFLKALNLNSAGEFVIGAVAVLFSLLYLVRLLRFIGWGSVLRGVLVLSAIGLIGNYFYKQQPPSNQQLASLNQQPRPPNHQPAPPIVGDLQAGFHAFDTGDYITALEKLKPLAEQGNSIAQVDVGLIYYEARGVAQDYFEASKWFLRAADQGEGMAQLRLGFMYGAGQGVTQDFVQSYMRFTLCTTVPKVQDNCVKNKDLLSRRMMPAQIAEGERLAREWDLQSHLRRRDFRAHVAEMLALPTQTMMKGSASLPIASYTLDTSMVSIVGLSEFSESEYGLITRMFEDEKVYNAPGVDFVNRHWPVVIGIVGGRIYKIVLYFSSEDKNADIDALTEVLQFCQQRLGKPSEQQDTMFTWDMPDGNVTLSLGAALQTYQVNLVETSSTARTFPQRQ